jgi:hypothetical protein
VSKATTQPHPSSLSRRGICLGRKVALGSIPCSRVATLLRSPARRAAQAPGAPNLAHFAEMVLLMLQSMVLVGAASGIFALLGHGNLFHHALTWSSA